MGRRLHVIPLLALGALSTACHDAERSLAPRAERLHARVSATQGLNGKIAFYSNRDGDFDIYAMNADGSGVTQLTNNPADEYLPLWSPDGTRITFGRCVAICDVVVINADGSGETVVTNDGFPGAWSPDSRQIAFGRSDGIFVVNVDGSGLARVADPQFVTGWSPDGRQLLLGNNSDGDFEIFALNLDGSGISQLTNNTANDGGGRWSPDGTRIAFTSDRDGGDLDIFVMSAHGDSVTQLTQNDVVTDGGPGWSPDGSQIAFDSDRDGDQEIFLMNADGSGVTQLTFNDAVVDAGPQIQPVPAANDAFANATMISVLPFSDAVNITAATMEAGEPPSSCSFGSSSQRTVWYSFTPTVTALVKASVNAGFSTVVGVYSGSLGGLAEITCRSPFVVRDATFQAQAGTTYHIQVDGMFGQTGVLELRLEVVPPPPNDLFVNATAIGALPFSDTVDLTGAGSEPGEPTPSCAAPFGSLTNSAWYRFTPGQTGSISATTFSGAFSSVVAAYTGSSVSSLSEVGCAVERGLGRRVRTRIHDGNAGRLRAGAHVPSDR